MKKEDTFILTEEEIKEVMEMRRQFEELTEHEKYVVKEALKPYFYGKKEK
jgi:hypothetical protein